MQGAGAKPGARVAVLGGGGFLGSHLVGALVEGEDLEVEALDRSLEKLSLSSDRLRRTRADITRPGILEEVVEANEIIVSTTAMCNPSQYNTCPVDVIEANFNHLVPLAELCSRSGRRLIHFSTCEVYGRMDESQQPLNEETSPLILGPVAAERWSYACAKQLLERLIWARGAHHGLEFTIIRPFNVIGPRMDYIPGVDGHGIPRVLACFMSSLMRGEPLELVAGGQQRRSFISVDDFTLAVLRVLQSPESCNGEILNIGNPGNDVSIEQLAELMIEIYFNLTGERPKPPTKRVTAEDFYGPGYDDCPARIPDIEKARRLLDWEPGRSLDEMLPEIVSDYVERYGKLVQGK